MKGLQQDWVEQEWLVNILYLYWAWVKGFLRQLLCTYTHALWTVRYFPLWSRYKARHLLDWRNKIPALRKCLVVCCLSTTVFCFLRFCELIHKQEKLLLSLASPPCPSIPCFFPPPEHSSFLLRPTHWRQQKAYILVYTLYN